MGIKGLHKLGEKYWDELYDPPSPIRGKLIVDGYGVLHELYRIHKIEWATGGCYADQVRDTQKYYGALVRAGVEPVVVLDGGGQDTNISDTIHRRNRDINDLSGELRKQHEITDKDSKEYKSHRLPILSRHVYLSSLKEIEGVKVFIADGKSLEIAVQLANSYKCPVLTDNSNFCVSGVKAGVIFVRNLHLTSVTGPVFKQSKLVSFLNLPNPDLIIAIVAIVGDGTDTTVPRLYYGGIKIDIQRICEEKKIDYVGRPWFLNIVDYFKAYGCESFQDFQAKIDSFNLSYTPKRKLAENCRNAFETYNIPDRDVNVDNVVDHTSLQCHASHESFHQVVRRHREGNFPVLVMDAVCVGKCVLDSDVGDAEQPPVPFMGRYVRKVMYGLASPFMNRSYRMGISEYCRSELPKSADKPWEYTLSKVEPQWRYKNLSVDVVFDMEPAKQTIAAREAMMEVLRVPDIVQTKLHKPSDEEYLLGIFTTHYWAQHLYQSKPLDDLDQLIRALVLNFLVCPQSEDYSHDQSYSHPMWIKVYHTLLQWQCLYKDVCSLNQMLLSPFRELPLTNILNGSFVIELALADPDSITGHRERLSQEKQDLYDRTIFILDSIKPSN